MIKDPKHIVISRTDSIGDVVLTLPMAGILKEYFPNCKISFLGKTYTQSIIERSPFVDSFINYDDYIKEPELLMNIMKENDVDVFLHVFPNKRLAKLVKLARIKHRVGTSHRYFHWLNCNHRLSLSRKYSDKHESQLNIELLSVFGINQEYKLKDLAKYVYLNDLNASKITPDLIDKNRFNLILHPMSQGSAREWGLNNYLSLAESLNEKAFKVFVSGTKTDGDFIRKNSLLLESNRVVDITGAFSLEEFIHFIDSADGLVACSTGPLHLSGVLNKHTIGFFAPMRPIHSGRWMPLGEKIKIFEKNKTCFDCKKGGLCRCIQDISVGKVQKYLEGIKK